MNQEDKRNTYIHHAMALVGGFFGTYALLIRSETFGSSETSNLIYLVVTGLNRDLSSFILRIGALACYIAGIVFATLVPKLWKKIDFRYISIGIDFLACIALAQIPAGVHPVLALYPMFFATAVQWLAFTNAAGYNSATIFSTNNLRQCFASLAEYLYDRKNTAARRKCLFYAGTLLCFHIGVVYAWAFLQLLGIQSIYLCIPLLLPALVFLLF